MHVDVRIVKRSRRVGRIGAYAHRGALKHVAHKSAAEDVMAVHSLDLHVRGANGAVRATAEHTTAEQST